MAKKRARDSESGRFIPLEEAKRRPKETTVETVRKPTCAQVDREMILLERLLVGSLQSVWAQTLSAMFASCARNRSWMK